MAGLLIPTFSKEWNKVAYFTQLWVLLRISEPYDIVGLLFTALITNFMESHFMFQAFLALTKTYILDLFF